MLGLSLVDGCLELFVLSTKDFNLPLDSFKLYFCVFGGQHLIFEITLGLQQLSTSFGMVLLFLLILFNPTFSIFLLGVLCVLSLSALC